MTPPVFLLGPQQPRPNLSSCLEALELEGPVVSITAGWQEWEGDTGWLSEHLGQPVSDLALYARTESVFARDPALFAAHRNRQDRLIALQRLYHARLAHALDAVQAIGEMGGPPDLRDHALRSALSAVRALDRYHLRQLRKVHAAFSQCAQQRHPELERERDEVREIIRRAGVVVIAGGHVAVLVSRLRLFDLACCLRTRPVLAWSAGAMAACPRIVLFHDHLPQGPRHPEVLDTGLGLVPRLVCFPHARARLSLEDRRRGALLARRLAPERCATLENGSVLQVREDRFEAARAVSSLDRDGRLAPFAPQ